MAEAIHVNKAIRSLQESMERGHQLIRRAEQTGDADMVLSITNACDAIHSALATLESELQD